MLQGKCVRLLSPNLPFRLPAMPATSFANRLHRHRLPRPILLQRTSCWWRCRCFFDSRTPNLTSNPGIIASFIPSRHHRCLPHGPRARRRSPQSPRSLHPPSSQPDDRPETQRFLVVSFICPSRGSRPLRATLPLAWIALQCHVGRRHA